MKSLGRSVKRKTAPVACLPVVVRGCKVASFGDMSGGIAACRSGALSVVFIYETLSEKGELDKLSSCFSNAHVSETLPDVVDVAILARVLSTPTITTLFESTHIVITSNSVSLDPFLQAGFHIQQQEANKPTVLSKDERHVKRPRRNAILPDSSEYVDAVAISLDHLTVQL